MTWSPSVTVHLFCFRGVSKYFNFDKQRRSVQPILLLLCIIHTLHVDSTRVQQTTTRQALTNRGKGAKLRHPTSC